MTSRTPLPKVVMFDLDNTLAESKQPLTRSMAHLMERLLKETRVAVISGGALPQFLLQVVGRLPSDTTLSNLYLLPISGAALYEYRNDEWHKIYEERLPENVAAAIETAMTEGARASGVMNTDAETWGPRIENRGGEVSFSALGQKAPVAEKKAWDPDKSKRLALQSEIQKRLPEGYVAAMGGATTIDVTKHGIDKAYGVHQLAHHLGIAESEMLYVGDELTEHGNDAAVFKTDIKTREVASPTATARLIGKMLGMC